MKTKTCFQIYPPLKGRLATQLKPTTETASTTTNFILITAGIYIIEKFEPFGNSLDEQPNK